MSDVFLSHSSKDSEIAENLCAFLEERGLYCWMAQRDVPPESHRATSINMAVTDSKVFLIICSENSAVSNHVARELSLAKTKKDVSVIAYKIDDSRFSGTLEYHLADAQLVTAKHKKQNDSFDELYTVIAGIIDHTSCTNTMPTGKQKSVQAEHQLASTSSLSAIPPAFVKKYQKLVIITAVVLVLLTGIIIAVNLNHQGTETVSSSDSFTVPTSMTESSDTTQTYATKKNIVVSYIGWNCTGNYTGELNENGVPDGNGEFEGTYTNNNNEDITLKYTGRFQNGVMIDDNAVLTETYTDGHKREYKGGVTNKGWDGKAILTITYQDGEISKQVYEGTWVNNVMTGSGKHTIFFTYGMVKEYKGEFSNGKWNGKAVLTLTYQSGNLQIKVFEGTWTDDILSGDVKVTITYTDGKIIVYEGGYSNENWNGKGTLTTTYTSGNIEKNVAVGDWVDGVCTGSATVTNYFQDGTKDETVGTYQDDQCISGTMTCYDSTEKKIKTEQIGTKTLSVPTDFNVTFDGTDATVTWDSVNNATGYEVSSPTANICKEPFIVLHNIQQGEKIKVKLRAISTDSDYIGYSDWIEFEFTGYETSIE